MYPISSVDDSGTTPQGEADAVPATVPARRPRGCRPRDLRGIAEVLDVLAAGVAADPALNVARTATGTVWIVPARDHQWQHSRRSDLLDGLNPVRGRLPARDPVLTEIAKTAVPLVPTLASATGGLLHRLRRGPGRAGRMPLVTEAELTTLWLTTLLGALCGSGWSGRLRLADLRAVVRDGADDDVVLFCDVTATAVLWVARGRPALRRRTTAVAQWTLATHGGAVVGAGVVTDR